MAKVLVVDDSLSVRKVVERALAGRQIEVVAAASGGEAIERMEREAPDIVVCDVVMPDRDGYEICEFVKNHPRLSGTPVLLMSGIVNDTVRERAARARASDILTKPFAADDLLKRIDQLLATRPASASTPAAETAEAGASAEDAAYRRADLVAAPAASAPRAELTPKPGDMKSILQQFGAMDGVQWAVVADREGFLIESTAEAGVDAEVAGALSACLAESSEGLGRELGRGALHGMILEYEKGMVVVYGIGATAILAVGLADASVLGKVRYFAKKALPELVRAV
ncbi:MAG TPA: response regulator [Methylomirabilota bacterium]|jgi:CheY-like chemotaxis protein/predicted regulator of Ras-like GTPase activity (Roadblock/LC7/MglB family)|nr:response regulator [Methylomirabilota bacterium]